MMKKEVVLMDEEQLQEPESKKVIVFQLIDKEYAMPIDVVTTIEKVLSITRVPNTPDYVKGVINLRGVVTPIVDLRVRFGMPPQEVDDDSRIIIVSMEDYEVGVIVDAASDVVDIFVKDIEPQPEVVGSVESEFISGVVKTENHLLAMLDLGRVLAPLQRGKKDD